MQRESIKLSVWTFPFTVSRQEARRSNRGAPLLSAVDRQCPTFVRATPSPPNHGKYHCFPFGNCHPCAQSNLSGTRAQISGVSRVFQLITELLVKPTRETMGCPNTSEWLSSRPPLYQDTLPSLRTVIYLFFDACI